MQKLKINKIKKQAEKKSKLSNLILIFCTALLLASTFLYMTGCRETLPEIETFEAEKGDIIESVSATGTVDSKDGRNYSLTQSAEVLEILSHGDAFKSFGNVSEVGNASAY